MRKVIIIILLSISGFTMVAQNKINIIPIPDEIKFEEGKFRIGSSIKINISGDPGDRLFSGTDRFIRRLDGRTGIFTKHETIKVTNEYPDGSIQFVCKRPGSLVINENESYNLKINSEQISINAETDIGVLRGIETLLQLLATDEDGYYFPAVNIVDKPRFTWRGLLIDMGRHWLPVDVILRNIDGMAAVKLNVLHLHLTEDQGFRIESKTFPKLHEMGSDGFYYTHEQMKEIISYASDRGIRVVPEFDMPGHATSWFVGYPWLASGPGPYSIEREWGIMNPTMDASKESTYEFLEKFFEEMCNLFPDEYIHIGGDENNGRQWDANADIQAFKTENYMESNHELQSYFNRRVLEILTKNGKRMVGWEEILQPEMPTNIVIQSWRGTNALIEAAKKGYQAMLSNGYYIDLIQSTDFHYLNDPLPEGHDLNDEQQKLVLGGEATMWGEQVTHETVDSRIWPRTAAIAERYWSGSDVRDIEDMYRRLKIMTVQLEELGLTHEKNYPMMLRRLTGGMNISSLKILVDVLEPVKGYARNAQSEINQLCPYTRIVDAARPDQENARLFRNNVSKFLAENNKHNYKLIIENLRIWMKNHNKLLPVIKANPVLWEIESISADLSFIAEIGLHAAELISVKEKADVSWGNESLELLKSARSPRAQTEIMIISAIEDLVKESLK